METSGEYTADCESLNTSEANMARSKCKNCDNRNDGDQLYRCKQCEKIYCEACLPNGSCDNCDAEWHPNLTFILPGGNLKRIGVIESNSGGDT